MSISKRGVVVVTTFPTRIGRLVLEAFIGPCPEGMECCHWDDDRTNNALSNLRWATPTDNVYDCIRNGRHNKAKMTYEQVVEARRLYTLDPVVYSRPVLANMFGVDISTMHRTVKREIWRHVL